MAVEKPLGVLAHYYYYYYYYYYYSPGMTRHDV